MSWQLAAAQTQPDAGAVLQQLQRKPPPAPATAPPSIATPANTLGLPDNTSFIVVSAFRFVGNTVFSDAQLQALVAPYLNRPVSFMELRMAAQAVAQAYRDAGWVVRAFLPEQEVQALGASLTIQVVEAVLGKTRIERDADARISAQQVQGFFDQGLVPGQRIHASAMDRALLLASDLPGAMVVGSLVAGDNPAQTDLLVQIGRQPVWQGSRVALDNGGSRSTGAERISATLALQSPTGHVEALTLDLSHTEGSDLVRAEGTLPLGSNGTRVGLSASGLSYRLVAPEFTALQARGQADTVGLSATHPLLRSLVRNVNVQLNLDHKAYDNQVAGASTSRYSLDSLGLGISGSQWDADGSGGFSSAALGLLWGRLNLAGSANQAQDAITTQSEGDFAKLTLHMTRQQPLAGAWALAADFNGQYAHKNLDSSEKFYLGGPAGVRAYPSGEAGGSLGYAARLELRWTPQRSYVLSAFYDYGQVQVNANNQFAGAASPNTIALEGAGLGLSWQGEPRAGVRPQASLVWAKRLGSNPHPLANGNDQDGSLVTDRIWLTASLQF